MHALITNLLAFTLVAHAMIGCCHHHWHHAGEPVSTCSTVMYSCPCCPHHADFDCEYPADSEPCNGELECQGVCRYLPTQRAEIDFSSDVLPSDTLVPHQANAEYLAASAGISLGVVDHNCNSPPLPTLVQLRQLLLI